MEIDANIHWSSPSPNLQTNLDILDPYQLELAKMLVEIEQGHLFEHWPEPGVDDEEKKALLRQVGHLDSSYNGGLTSYVKTAKLLLADSKAGRNPFDGFTPSVPVGETLSFGNSDFINFEEIGLKEAQKAAFVLVAGGLGERLGYNGIKVALPSETTSGTCFLQHFIDSIVAFQESSFGGTKGYIKENVFVIMTSDDTHSKTLALLESNDYFGMNSTHIKLLKQEKVACLSDNNAKLAVDPHNKYKIQTKPHGHGDVHSLLYNSGLLTEWCDADIKWVLFFQDTNALVFKAIPAALGVSSVRRFHVNSLAVPRKAKEAIGGISKLTHSDGRTMVINVEYNQLDPLLRASGFPDGDVNCETGYSPFPGNINQLIVELVPYLEELTKTRGVIQEFINPKYADDSKTTFKSSTRLECMMQDYPKTLPSSARVGFTVFDSWFAYAPVKNNPIDAAKVPLGNPYHSATSGELAVYQANCKILQKAGVEIGEAVKRVLNGQEVEVWARIVWKPNWGRTFAEVKSKVSGECRVSGDSTLVIDGRDVFLKGLRLDGALVVKKPVGGAGVTIGGCVQNKGWVMETVDYHTSEEAEEIRIRGFKFNKLEQTCLV